MMRKLFIPLLLLILIGCGVNPGLNPEQVDITGTLKQGGKPISNVQLNFQATGDGAHAIFDVKNGAFKGKMTPGKYTWFLEGKNVPQKYLSGSLDRQLKIPGDSLNLSVD